jgi:hypothetical protein
MTSYWTPRWPRTVLFGSHRELKYRLDLAKEGPGRFRMSTHGGTGFALELRRSEGPPGWAVIGLVPEAARSWLAARECGPVLADLLSSHFSSISMRPDAIVCICDPDGEDLVPEGAQLDWCLELVCRLWRLAPESERRTQSRAAFMGSEIQPGPER